MRNEKGKPAGYPYFCSGSKLTEIPGSWSVLNMAWNTLLNMRKSVNPPKIRTAGAAIKSLGTAECTNLYPNREAGIRTIENVIQEARLPAVIRVPWIMNHR